MLADLAFQLANPFASRSKVTPLPLVSSSGRDPRGLNSSRPPSPPQAVRPFPAEMPAPLRKLTFADPQLSRQRRTAFASQMRSTTETLKSLRKLVVFLLHRHPFPRLCVSFSGFTPRYLGYQLCTAKLPRDEYSLGDPAAGGPDRCPREPSDVAGAQIFRGVRSFASLRLVGVRLRRRVEDKFPGSLTRQQAHKRQQHIGRRRRSTALTL